MLKATESALDGRLDLIERADQRTAAAPALAAHETFGGQHAEGVADGVSTHAQLDRQLVFTWQLRTWLNFATSNQLAQVGFELAMEGVPGGRLH